MGMKVSLPNACASVAAASQAPTGAEEPRAAEVADSWDHLSSETLQDWIDLDDLGGSVPWPARMNAAVASDILRARGPMIRATV